MLRCVLVGGIQRPRVIVKQVHFIHKIRRGIVRVQRQQIALADITRLASALDQPTAYKATHVLYIVLDALGGITVFPLGFRRSGGRFEPLQQLIPGKVGVLPNAGGSTAARGNGQFVHQPHSFLHASMAAACFIFVAHSGQR